MFHVMGTPPTKAILEVVLKLLSRVRDKAKIGETKSPEAILNSSAGPKGKEGRARSGLRGVERLAREGRARLVAKHGSAAVQAQNKAWLTWE
jgi:hypothetical protein